jgi:nucleoside recognition membrane protein YjiH
MGRQVVQFINIDSSSFEALAKSVGVQLGGTGNIGYFGAQLAPFMMWAGWKRVKFIRNMRNRARMKGAFHFPGPSQRMVTAFR